VQLQFQFKISILTLFLFLIPPVLYAQADGQAGVDVIKNAIDKRDYRVLTLPNGLRALLISDPDTDLAAAAMNVNVGYFSDPPDRAGLAHFLEHMLFLGTEKYPEADAYREFITRHGGRINAFVGAENTVYFFDIDRNRLEDAFDRFAQFFVAPLFDEEYVQREMNAIDSEFRMGIREDSRRLNDVFRETVNPEHPYAKFSVGSLATLEDREDDPVRDAVIEFYERHYSAGIMTLAVVGADPVERLAEMVGGRLGAVRNTGAKPLEVDVPLHDPDAGPLRINVIPLRDTREIRFEFVFPWKDEYHLSKPAAMLGHLIGHEGNGSLHELLKDRGWINSLSAGGRRIASNEGVFIVSINLTHAGIDHIEEIGDALFRYIALVGQEGIRPSFHEELRRINTLNFEFRESANPAGEVISLAGNLQTYPDELALFGPYYIGEYDEEEIHELFGYLRPDNLRLSVMAPDLPADRISLYYRTEYGVEALDEALQKRWSSPEPDPALSIPAPNPFLPEQTALRAAGDGLSQIPLRLIDEDGLELWHLQDTEFEVPRADLFITFESARAVASIREHVMTTLFLALARDALNAHAYPARLAGLSYSLHGNLRGFGVSVSGYDDKQPLLLDLIIGTLLDLDVDPDRFAIRRAELVRQWDNARLARPFIQLQNGLQTLLHAGRWTPEARIAAIESITVEDLEAFIPELFAQTRLEVLVHGNLTAQEAVAIGRDFSERVFARAKPGERVIREVARLAPGRQYLLTLDIDHDDTSLIVHYQAPDDDIATAAAAMLLEQVIKSPFFDTLRTREQLGYVVAAHSALTLRVPGLNFVIQSPVAGPAALLARIDGFITEFPERIEAMDDGEFEGYRQGLLTMLRERDTSQSRRSQRLQHDLALGHLSFDRRERLAEAAEALTRDDLLAVHDAWLLSGERRRIVLQSPGNQHRDDALDHERHGFEMVTAPDTFREGLPAFRL
jgi:insulysin